MKSRIPSPRLCFIALSLLAFSSASVDFANASEPQAHPLSPVLDFAVARRDYIKENVSDYTCWLVKRERIGGELQPYHYAKMNVRCEQTSASGERKPMAVFMRFSRPAEINDRRVLFVDGENNGDVLVRKGGSLLKNVKLTIDPESSAARRESNYPITEIGLDKIMDRLILLARQDIDRDPTGENTKVEYFENAKVGDRYCTRIEVKHLEEKPELAFHKAQLFVDEELRVPIRLVVHDWPDSEGQEPKILEEYTYMKLQLNVGLTDEDFSETLLAE